jgi:ATP-dependent DNA helicase RecG
MVVESAERFGLSQLHQLRGRVGRGDRASWCILLTGDAVGESTRRRLEVLASTGDGFEIAEADLVMRGPGELAGLRQWGHLRFRFADLAAHGALAEKARRAASTLAGRGELERVLRGLSRYHHAVPADAGG